MRREGAFCKDSVPKRKKDGRLGKPAVRFDKRGGEIGNGLLRHDIGDGCNEERQVENGYKRAKTVASGMVQNAAAAGSHVGSPSNLTVIISAGDAPSLDNQYSAPRDLDNGACRPFTVHPAS